MSQCFANSITSIRSILFFVIRLAALEVQHNSHGQDASWYASNYHHSDKDTDVQLAIRSSYVVQATASVGRAVAQHAACFAAIKLFFYTCVSIISIIVQNPTIHPNFHSRLISKSLDIWKETSTCVGSVNQRTTIVIIKELFSLNNHESVVFGLSFWSKWSRFWFLYVPQLSHILHTIIRINIAFFDKLEFLLPYIRILVKICKQRI